MRINNLDLNLLAVLDALLTYQNVTRAAEQLNLTQPTISNALARLRHHFKDELLVLVGRRMTPTPFAASLREPIAELLKLTRRVSGARSTFIPKEAECSIEIIASDYIADILIFDLVRDLAQAAPGISLRLTPPSPDAVRHFSDGKADLMIVPADSVESQETDVELFRDSFVPVVWADHPAIGEELSVQEFEENPHAVVEFDSVNTLSMADIFFDSKDYKREVRVRLPSYVALANAIIGTPYIATLPYAFARKRVGPKGLRIVKPSFPYPWLIEAMKWPRHLNADACNRWLRSFVLEHARNMALPHDQQNLS